MTLMQIWDQKFQLLSTQYATQGHLQLSLTGFCLLHIPISLDLHPLHHQGSMRCSRAYAWWQLKHQVLQPINLEEWNGLVDIVDDESPQELHTRINGLSFGWHDLIVSGWKWRCCWEVPLVSLANEFKHGLPYQATIAIQDTHSQWCSCYVCHTWVMRTWQGPSRKCGTMLKAWRKRPVLHSKPI